VILPDFAGFGENSHGEFTIIPVKLENKGLKPLVPFYITASLS